MSKRLAAEIERELRGLRSPSTAAVRTVRRRWSKQLRDAPAAEVVATAFQLLERFGRRFVACELLCFQPAALASLRATQLRRLGRGMKDWAAVDTFGTLVAGRVWREHQVSDALIHGWARSKDRWWRRAALVCTVPLNIQAQGGEGDTARTLAVCRLLIDDRDDMVVKALSWALRVLVAHDARAVRGLVARHEAALAPRVLREVRNKLGTGLKNPRGGRAATRRSSRRPRPGSPGSRTKTTAPPAR